MYLQNASNKNKPHALHKVFLNLNKYIVLTSALLIWSIIPIIGIIFILLYCQINISNNYIRGKKKPFVNLIPIILVIFTISTYIASFKSFNDTDIYIDLYKSLSHETLFTLPDVGMEPVSFLLPKYLSKLTGGNELTFLFFQSLTMNTALTICSIIFIPEFYPLIILINLMNQGYYFQLFWMRQFYSFIFVVPALYVDFFIWRWIFIYIAFFTHNSSLICIVPLIITAFKNIVTDILNNIRRFFRIKNTITNAKFFILTFFLLLVAFSGQFMGFFVDYVGNSSLLESSSSQKIAIYSGDASAAFNQEHFTIRNQLRTLADYIIVFIFAINADYTKTNTVFFRWLFLFMIVFALYVGSFAFGFNLRISSIFFCVPGFFYTIAFYSGKLDKRINIYTSILCISIILRILYFLYSLIASYESENYLVFWNGETLTTPITGYLKFFVKCLEGIF